MVTSWIQSRREKILAAAFELFIFYLLSFIRLMSGVKNNIGRGINIALINGMLPFLFLEMHACWNLFNWTVTTFWEKLDWINRQYFTGKTGELTKADSFDMWSGGKSVFIPHILFSFANLVPVVTCICILLKSILGDHLT